MAAQYGIGFQPFLDSMRSGNSGWYGKGINETGGSYYAKDSSGQGFWATPTYDGQTFDQSSGLMSNGPLKSWRVTKDLGEGKATNVFGGGGSGQYEGMAYDEYDPTGQYMGSENWSNMGTDKFTDLGALLVAIAATAGVGSAVAGGAAAAGGAGAGGGSFGSFAGPAAGAGGGGGAAAVGGGGGLAGLLGGGGGSGLGSIGTIGKIGSALAPLLGGGGSNGGGSSGGGLGGLGNLGLQDIIGLIGGGVDANRQGDAAEKMLAWLNGNQAKMEGLYSPDSPESKYLWQEMSRKDAAAGRNSQYGPRTVDFAGKVAADKADNIRQFTTGTSRAYADALNQDASKYAGLSAALQRAAGGGGQGLTLGNILSLIGGGGGLNLGGGIGMGADGSITGIGDDGWTGGTMSNDDIWDMINGGSYDFGGGVDNGIDITDWFV